MIRILICNALLTLVVVPATTFAAENDARPNHMVSPPQIIPSDERVVGIIAQQALVNARLGVEIDQLRQTIRKLEADLAQAKRELEAECKSKE